MTASSTAIRGEYALNIMDLGKLVQIFIVFWKPSLKPHINIQRKKQSLAHKVDHRDGKSATRHRPSCWNHTRWSLLAARVSWYARDLIGHRNHQHRFVLLGSLVKGETKNQETAIVYRFFMWWFYHHKKIWRQHLEKASCANKVLLEGFAKKKSPLTRSSLSLSTYEGLRTFSSCVYCYYMGPIFPQCTHILLQIRKSCLVLRNLFLCHGEPAITWSCWVATVTIKG